MKKAVYMIKPILATVLFSLALAFENASKERALILMGIFILYILSGLVRPYFQDRWPLLVVLEGGFGLSLRILFKIFSQLFFPLPLHRPDIGGGDYTEGKEMGKYCSHFIFFPLPEEIYVCPLPPAQCQDHCRIFF